MSFMCLLAGPTVAGDTDGVAGYKFKIEGAGGGDWVDNGGGGTIGGNNMSDPPEPQPMEFFNPPRQHLLSLSFDYQMFRLIMLFMIAK
jgi:hypothetical protein